MIRYSGTNWTNCCGFESTRQINTSLMASTMAVKELFLKQEERHVSTNCETKM